MTRKLKRLNAKDDAALICILAAVHNIVPFYTLVKENGSCVVHSYHVTDELIEACDMYQLVYDLTKNSETHVPSECEMIFGYITHLAGTKEDRWYM